MKKMIKELLGAIAYFSSPRIKEKTNSVCDNYDQLIKQYQEIKNKKSLLTKSQRDDVVKKVDYLVKIGHLKAS